MNCQYQDKLHNAFDKIPTLDETLKDAYALSDDTEDSAPEQNDKIEEMEL